MPWTKNKTPPASLRQEVRIIAGQWRGTKIRFPDVRSVRPTPDRVRETLFNWLSPLLTGAHCLDLFAGSGALGLEALSRGAARVVFVESDRQLVAHLSAQLTRFNVTGSVVVQQDALSYLQQAQEKFSIVFLDPPYDSQLLAPVLSLLTQCALLQSGARIYLESRFDQALPVLPSEWTLYRSKQAGQVNYHLATYRVN